MKNKISIRRYTTKFNFLEIYFINDDTLILNIMLTSYY